MTTTTDTTTATTAPAATTGTTTNGDTTAMNLTATRPASSGELVPATHGTEREIDQPSAGALALRNTQTQWTEDQYAALMQLGLENAGPANLKVLMHVAQRTGLDPFSRQIYLIGRQVWDPMLQRKVMRWTIQTGIDGFRIIADRRPEYKGQTEPQWCGDDGVWVDVWLSSKPPAAARVGVYRSDFQAPVYAVTLFREFAQYKASGDLTSMWATKSAHMIAKCAEAGGLRKAFPNDLGGMYTDDEMPAEGATHGIPVDVETDDDVSAADLTSPPSTVDGEFVVTGTAEQQPPATTSDTTTATTTATPGALPELTEDEAVAFAQYCEELPAATTEPLIRKAWSEAASWKWLARPVLGGNGEKVGDVLTAAAKLIKREAAPA